MREIYPAPNNAEEQKNQKERPAPGLARSTNEGLIAMETKRGEDLLGIKRARRYKGAPRKKNFYLRRRLGGLGEGGKRKGVTRFGARKNRRAQMPEISRENPT